MEHQATNYDDVRQYRLDPERERELVRTAGECVFVWANKMAQGTAAAYSRLAAEGTDTEGRNRWNVPSAWQQPSRTTKMSFQSFFMLDRPQDSIAVNARPLRRIPSKEI